MTLQRLVCEHYKDQKSGLSGSCVSDASCCSGPAIDNICPYRQICCFGSTDVCGPNNNNNIHTECSADEILTRKDWSANRPNRLMPILGTNIGHVFVHHTDDGESCFTQSSCMRRVRSIQSYHQNTKGWPDIGYNFLIGGDGLVYEGRGWHREGSHTLGWNGDSIGIAFIGNFDHQEPNDDMINAAQYLLSCGVESGALSDNYRVHGHRDARCTSCPGQALYDVIKEWPEFRGGPLAVYHC